VNKKNVFLWTLYDFANSIAIVIFSVYFSEWLVVERHVKDIWYNAAFSGAVILLLFTAPILGIIADKTGNRMKYLRTLTIFLFLSLTAVSLLAITAPQKVFIIVLIFTFANYFYQFSFSFYNPLLHDIAPAEKQGFISGVGQAANWLGQIAGLLITLPSAVLFFLLALPMLLWFQDPIKKTAVQINLTAEYKNYWVELKALLARPGVARFLFGYFFFNDAVLTVSNNFAIYVDQIYKITDKTKSLLFLSILLTSAIGAFITGWVADRVGVKKTLIAVLSGWVITFPLVGFLTSFNAFFIGTVLMGFLFGSIWTVTRAVMVYLAPADKLNHAFSYYTMFERFSSLVGPITWGVITSVIFHTGQARYRIAMVSMSVFIALGLVAVWKIPSDKKSVPIYRDGLTLF
jgi:UMF1 family MFS transporter